jgi:hypothetical protein
MTKEIKLSHGKTAIVDNDWHDYLSQWKWRANFSGWKWYAFRNEGGKIVKMHRVIMGVTDRNIQVDHINGKSLDNRRANLRLCTMAENQRNRGPAKSNTSGFKGVYWDTRAGKWHAHITVNNKKTNLGLYADSIDAARAYNAAATKWHGPFAYLNPIPSPRARND